jgi:hypothetical protein
VNENAPPGHGEGSASLHTSEAPISQHHRSHHDERSVNEEIVSRTDPVNACSGASGENISELPAAKWKRRFERGTPDGALTWKTAAQRSKRMFAWKCAVLAKYKSRATILCVACLLESLCLKEGYAYATDTYISSTIGIHVNHVQTALTALERGGAIVRASVFVNGKPRRRIWPATQIIPTDMVGMDTHGYGTQDTHGYGGGDSLRYAPTPRTPRMTATQTAARKSAELRDEAARRTATSPARSTTATHRKVMP